MAPSSPQWFFGRVTHVTAELYVRLPDNVSRLKPSVVVTGPHSRYARTLATSVTMRPQDSSHRLWQATLEDPCFWTPRQPYRYEVRINVKENAVGGQSDQPEGGSTMIGVPVLVARQDRLELEGRNWTLRAIASPHFDIDHLTECHASGTALCQAAPSDQLCELASFEGVTIVADLSSTNPAVVPAELRRLARWPAVGIVILPAVAELDAALRQETAHVIRAQAASADAADSPRDWAQLLIAEFDNLPRWDDGIRNRSGGLGIIVRSRNAICDLFGSQSVATDNSDSDRPRTQVAFARQACDSLQAELAGRGDISEAIVGYMVG